MTNKNISTRCRYMETIGQRRDKPICGDGYCIKNGSAGSSFCKMIHKYSYVCFVNIVLLYVMYSDVVFWLFKDNLFNIKLYALMIFPVIMFGVVKLIQVIVRWGKNKNKLKRYQIRCKVNLIRKVVGEDHDNLDNVITEILLQITKQISGNKETAEEKLIAELQSEISNKFFADKFLQKRKL